MKHSFNIKLAIFDNELKIIIYEYFYYMHILMKLFTFAVNRMTRQMHNKIKNNQMHLLHRATTLHQLKVIRLLPRAINLTLKAIRLPPRAINLTQRVISQTLRVIRLLPHRVTRRLPQREIIQLRQIVTPKREINPQTRLTPPNLLPQQVKKVLSLKGTVQGPNQAGTSLSQINS